MDSRLRCGIVALVIAAGGGVSGEAAAACRNGDLVGRWMIHSMTLSDLGGNVSRCTVTIGKRGRASGTCTNRVPDYRERTSIAVVLRVTKACAVSGTGIENGVRGTLQGQMAPSKDFFSGITFSSEAISHFTAVRR